MNWKAHFSRALAAAPGRLHFAAHSHHLWPDVSFDAHQRAWDDAMRLADHKWDLFDGEVMPKARELAARRTRLTSGRSVVFAPSTHALVVRLLSCLPVDRPLRVLTTDCEFYSFRRQLDRLEEAGRATSVRVAVEPWGGVPDRLVQEAAAGQWDLVYFSQVFFDSAYALTDDELSAIVGAVGSSSDRETLVVIDGYHGFMARPTDLSGIEDRAFYLAGGYKYAMAGEGACWMHAPAGFGARPMDTGWFASFDALTEAQPDRTPFPPGDDASRFLGATLDPTPIYRFVAVQEWTEREGITPEVVHAHARRLQDRLLDQAGPWADVLLPPRARERGNFLVFRTRQAGAVRGRLREAGVIVDHRADRLRLGFGVYQDDADVDAAAGLLRDAWPG